MRMATRHRRRWIATGGATAAVAIGIWAAVALATPTPSAPTPHGPGSHDHADVADDAVDGPPATTCTRAKRRRALQSSYRHASVVGVVPIRRSTRPGDGTYCYRSTGHYGRRPDQRDRDGRCRRDAAHGHDRAARRRAFVSGNVPITISASDEAPARAATTTPSSTTRRRTITRASGTRPARARWHVHDSRRRDGRRRQHRSRIARVTVDNHPPAHVHCVGARRPWPAARDLLDATAPTPQRLSRTGSSAAGPAATCSSTPCTSGWTDPTNRSPLGTYTYTVQAVDVPGST